MKKIFVMKLSIKLSKVRLHVADGASRTDDESNIGICTANIRLIDISFSSFYT